MARPKMLAWLAVVGLAVGGLAEPEVRAKTVPIADTGFSLTLPDNYAVSQPPGAPDILLQGDRPDGNGTVQVVRANPAETLAVMATGYETKMRQALGNLSRQQGAPRLLAGRAGELRTYRAMSNGMTIRVQAAFYNDGARAFIIHAIDTTNQPGEFEAAITSLAGPAPAQPTGTGLATGVAGQVGLGDSGYVINPPGGWVAHASTRPDGMQFGLPDKSALLEALWLPVEGAAAAPAVLLEQTLTQLEGGFGGGWQMQERLAGGTARDHSLFKRFGGQIGGVPAELLVYGVTDGAKVILAYGYYATAHAGVNGVALRTALTGIHRPGLAAGGIGAPSLPSSLPSPAVGAPPVPAVSAPPAAPPASVALPPGWVYYQETTTGLEIPHPAGWVVERASGAVTLSGPAGTPAYDTTINVQALRRADAANRDLATAVQSFSRGLQGQGAKIDVSDPGTLAGAPAHFMYAAAKVGHADRSGYTHIFRYILIERPEVIAVVSYVSSIDDWEHYRPIAQQSEAAIRIHQNAGRPVAATSPARPTHGADSAALAKLDSIETWKLLHQRVTAQNWRDAAVLLEPEAVKNHLLRVAEEYARRAGLNPDTLSPEPLPRLLAILEQVPTAAATLAYLARPPVKITVRKENDHQHLVMVELADNNQHYYWMRRVNGRWMHTPN